VRRGGEGSKAQLGLGRQHGRREGVCTGALLPNDAKSARNSLIVGKHRSGRTYSHTVQTVHGASLVVCVRVAVDDANEDAGHAHWKLLYVGLGVFPENEAPD